MRYEGINNLNRNKGDLLSIGHGVKYLAYVCGVEIQSVMFVLQNLGLKGTVFPRVNVKTTQKYKMPPK